MRDGKGWFQTGARKSHCPISSACERESEQAPGPSRSHDVRRVRRIRFWGNLKTEAEKAETFPFWQILPLKHFSGFTSLTQSLSSSRLKSVQRILGTGFHMSFAKSLRCKAKVKGLANLKTSLKAKFSKNSKSSRRFGDLPWNYLKYSKNPRSLEEYLPKPVRVCPLSLKSTQKSFERSARSSFGLMRPSSFHISAQRPEDCRCD